MSKNEIINQTISKFREECNKIESTDLIDKIHLHEELLIKTILETVLKNN